MNSAILIKGRTVSVCLNLHAIKIFNNDELVQALKHNTEAATDELVIKLKAAYFKTFNTEFKVLNTSIAVEIWAHIYAEKFAEALKSFSSIKFIDLIADKIIYHAKEIDIGEKGYDNNRFIWDDLEIFKSPIAKVLFANK